MGMNWTRLALITVGAGIITSLTDWFFAGDWLHRRYTYPEIWRQNVEARAIALTSPLPFLTCGVFAYVTARLGIHSVAGAVKLAVAVWLVDPLPLILTNAAFMKLVGEPAVREGLEKMAQMQDVKHERDLPALLAAAE